MLCGALMIGADLRHADLSGADVIGADFRGADLRGADLTGTIFLIQSQLDVAVGDAATRIDDTLRRPAHWSATQDGATSGPQPGRSESRRRRPAPRTDRAARRGRG
jgi:hypothetical protein